MKWQVLHHGTVGWNYLQKGHSIQSKLCCQRFNLSAQFQLPKATFDGNFPVACHTHPNFSASITQAIPSIKA